MDGLPTLTAPAYSVLSRDGQQERTLQAPIGCTGVGLHSGQAVLVRLLPAHAGHGIVFHRTDLDLRIPARFDHVIDTRLCTVIGLAGHPTARVGTIEHLMAALSATGIGNLVIEVDGPEIPVLDGSSEPWLFLLDCAGIRHLDRARQTIEVLRTIRVEEGDAFAELRPNDHGLDMALSIAFDAPAIGRQALTLSIDTNSFRRDLARARTFAQKHEIEGLQRAGLARGGSLENAVVVDGASVLNPAGLRMQDEFVRHKMLDAIGDLALGGALQARFIGHKSGHALNNRLLRALFAHSAHWRHAASFEALAA